MIGRLFVDTNILIYALDPGDPEKRSRAVRLLAGGIQRDRLVIGPQTVNECYRVLAHKRRIVPRAEAREFLTELLPLCTAPLDMRRWPGLGRSKTARGTHGGIA